MTKEAILKKIDAKLQGLRDVLWIKELVMDYKDTLAYRVLKELREEISNEKDV